MSAKARAAPRLSVEVLEDRVTPSVASYITSLYVNLLHRSPAQAEVNQWLADYVNGMSTTAIATAFVKGPEYRTDFVFSCYQLVLSRTPTAAEAAGWVNVLAAGASNDQLEAAFLSSAEFVQAHPGGAAPWINAVYEVALGRPADPAGLAGWTLVAQAGYSPFDIAFAIVNSFEAHDRVVNDAYNLLLGRAAAPYELAAWDQQIVQGMSTDLVLVNIVNSTEYWNRYGGLHTPAPPHGNGTGPFYDEPYCADPLQFGPLPSGGSGGSFGSTASGGSTGSGGGSFGSGGSGGSGGGSGGSGGGSGGSGGGSGSSG